MATPEQKPEKATSGGLRVKYMGSADIARIDKGYDFSGQYPDRLAEDLVFDASNGWTLDLANVPKEVQDLILADSDRFKDVTEMKRVPPNLNQTIHGGVGATTDDSVRTTIPSPPGL